MLRNCGMGFGATALSALFRDNAFAGLDSAGRDRHEAFDPLKPRQPHFPPRAKNVIFLYMDGGVSHVDTFDYKPMLDKHNGEDPHKLMKVRPTQFNNIGKILASPWKFKNYGKSGLPVSDLFPNVGAHADDLCVLRSMTVTFSEHTNANYFLHTGFGLQGRPSMGAWAGYGLGSENQDLPGFVVVNGGLIPPGGLDNFNSGFLPAAYQGSVFRAADPPLANVRRSDPSDAHQRSKLELMRSLDAENLKR
ncbi:MAG: sulfatase, partial [Opitutales bacterium]|nr:sulfatase [Opitutales bacterium]